MAERHLKHFFLRYLKPPPCFSIYPASYFPLQSFFFLLPQNLLGKICSGHIPHQFAFLILVPVKWITVSSEHINENKIRIFSPQTIPFWDQGGDDTREHLVKFQISGLLRPETRCTKSGSHEKWLCSSAVLWFSWSTYCLVLFGLPFFHITLLCAVWLDILACNQRRICVSTDRSQFGAMMHALEIHPWVHGGSSLLPEIKPEQWKQFTSSQGSEKHTQPNRTVPYCTLHCAKCGFQQRCIKHHFGAIHLFYELIIHDHLESRAMNITDDTHEAIYQSAGNRWTRLAERSTV